MLRVRRWLQRSHDRLGFLLLLRRRLLRQRLLLRLVLWLLVRVVMVRGVSNIDSIEWKIRFKEKSCFLCVLKVESCERKIEDESINHTVQYLLHTRYEYLVCISTW